MARRPRSLNVTLNGDQERALAEIKGSIEARIFHLLTGYAGTGKTTLLQVLAEWANKARLNLVLTAPTHKAVSVLERKLKAAGIDVKCATVHSLLGLKAKVSGDRLLFERRKDADPVDADIVVIDECSMIGADLMGHCRLWLQGRAVLFSGDPAQLPPVNEAESESFSVERRSHLGTIVRQAAENPLLEAAGVVRRSQGGPMDWSWVHPAKGPKMGIFMPGDQADAWMHKGFTSPEFKEDTDRHRYLCWTNARVADVNAKVRRWIYDNRAALPFVEGERALIRDAFVQDKNVILNASQEVTISAIDEAEHTHEFKKRGRMDGFRATVPTWKLKIRTDDGMSYTAHLPRDDSLYRGVVNRLAGEAKQIGARWEDFHSYKGGFVNAQAIYAQTIHTSQGSTFRNAFLDIPEVQTWARRDRLEAQRGLYVGMTRPSHTLTLVGVAA